MLFSTGKSQEVWDKLRADPRIEQHGMFHTGHRPKDIGKCYNPTDPLFIEVKEQAKSFLTYSYEDLNVRWFSFGGALGWDMISFYAAMELKQEQFPDMELILLIPYEEQPFAWIKGLDEQIASRDSSESVANFLMRMLDSDLKFWGRDTILNYYEMFKNADHIVFVDELKEYSMKNVKAGKYHVAKLTTRNTALVDSGNVAFAFYNGSQNGGTADCVKKALRAGRVVVSMMPGSYKLSTLGLEA